MEVIDAAGKKVTTGGENCAGLRLFFRGPDNSSVWAERNCG